MVDCMLHEVNVSLMPTHRGRRRRKEKCGGLSGEASVRVSHVGINLDLARRTPATSHHLRKTPRRVGLRARRL